MKTADLDRAHCWHPFTNMRDWCEGDAAPAVIVRGEGTSLWDEDGNRYFDGNSSIWTNIHGHSHPTIVEAIQKQAGELAHTSFLGTANVPAAKLAGRLVEACARGGAPALQKVFYSDDGSTAIECALQMEMQYRQLLGHEGRTRYVAFDRAYHGDTLGAASVGGIPTFHDRVAKLGLDVIRVPDLDSLLALPEAEAQQVAAVVIEPLIQGAAGMKTWPTGMLRGLRGWCDANGAHLILDEVMTGFGRTGTLFAFEQEGIAPDYLALAKGLTGGTMPLAATITTSQIFDAFLGDFAEQKTFYYGHSYSGNPLGCAAALASLDVFEAERTIENLQPKIAHLRVALARLQDGCANIGEVRQVGFIAGIDVVPDAASGEAFDWRERVGARVCQAARHHGLLTRPVLDTIVLMPPLSATVDEIDAAVAAIAAAIAEVAR